MSNFQNQVTNIHEYPEVADALSQGKDVQMRRRDTSQCWQEWVTGNWFNMDGHPESTEYRLVRYEPPKKVWVNVRMNLDWPHQLHSYAHTSQAEAVEFARNQSEDKYLMLVIARCAYTGTLAEAYLLEES